MRPLWLMLGAAFLSSAAQAAPLTYWAHLKVCALKGAQKYQP